MVSKRAAVTANLVPSNDICGLEFDMCTESGNGQAGLLSDVTGSTVFEVHAVGSGIHDGNVVTGSSVSAAYEGRHRNRNVNSNKP